MRERQKNDSDVATHINNGVGSFSLASFSVGLNLYVILKRALRELGGSRCLLPPFEGEHRGRVRPTHVSPQGHALASYMVG